MPSLLAFNNRIVRVVKRRRLVKVPIVFAVILILWRPAFLFGDPSFFLPRLRRQIALNHTYVHDARHTCVVERKDRTNTEKGPDLVVLVLSKGGHSEHRNAIRETYGSLARGRPWPDKLQNQADSSVIRKADFANERIRKMFVEQRSETQLEQESGDLKKKEMSGSVRLVFLLGQKKDVKKRHEEAERLALESDEFGDLVQWEGLEEDYFSLTYKVLLGFRWVKDFCSSARFVVKVDEDTFLHIPRLFRHIQHTYGSTKGWSSPQRVVLSRVPGAQYRPSKTAHRGRFSLGLTAHRTFSLRNGVIHGHLHHHSFVPRWGKYGVSYRTYPFLFYPPYSAGNTYFMKTSVALRILSVAEYFPYNYVEDAHVTGTLARAAGVSHLGLSNAEYDVTASDPGICLFADDVRISARDLSPSKLRQIWRGFVVQNACNNSS